MTLKPSATLSSVFTLAVVFVACGDDGDKTAQPEESVAVDAATDAKPSPGDGGVPRADADVAADADASSSVSYPEISGSRLRGRRILADGLSQFLGWHDRQEDVFCARSWVGGDLACAPPFSSNAKMFPTSACDPAAVLVSPRSQVACETTAFVGFEDEAGVEKVHRLGAAVALEQCWVGESCLAGRPGECTGAELGAELSVVRAESSVDDGRSVVTYEDGAREPGDFQSGGVPCVPGLAVDGTTRCFPAGSGTFVSYLDDACNEPVVQSVAVVAGQVSIGVERSACGEWKSRLYATGEAVQTSEPLYERSAEGECRPTVPMEVPLVRLGAEIPPDSLPLVTKEERGDLRLRARYELVGQQERFVSWFDTRLGVTCTFREIGGELSCVPDERIERLPRGISPFFSDAQCTELLTIFEKRTTPACEQEPLLYLQAMDSVCRLEHPLVEPLPVPAGVTYYESGGPNGCRVSTQDMSQYFTIRATGRLVTGIQVIE